MPVRGWICGVTRAKVGFDHYETCDHGPRGLPAYSPFLARLAAEKIAGDIRHTTLDLTATGIQDCPRRIYLDRTVDYWLDPSRSAAMHRGTALHSVMARTLDPAIWSTEATDPVRHDLRGDIGGYQVSALADFWKRDLSLIGDGKFPKDWSVKFRGKDAKARLEHSIQLNIERHLMAQQPWAIDAGYDPATVKLTVWDHGIGATEGPLMQEAAHMTVDEILSARPWGAATTVADHMAMLTQVRAEDGKLEPGDVEGRERLAAAIPLVGQPMFSGKKCDGCDLRNECDALVRKYGAPKV